MQSSVQERQCDSSHTPAPHTQKRYCLTSSQLLTTSAPPQRERHPPLAQPTASSPAAALTAPAIFHPGGNINAHIYRLFWFCCFGGGVGPRVEKERCEKTRIARAARRPPPPPNPARAMPRDVDARLYPLCFLHLFLHPSSRHFLPPGPERPSKSSTPRHRVRDKTQ